MMRLNLAFRNLRRNVRRSLVSFAMMVAGFCAIVIFNGFAGHLVSLLKMTAIDSQYGHAQIATKKSWDLVADEDIAGKYIQEPASVIELVKKNMPLEYVSGRLSFYGLLTKSDRSVSVQAIGFDPTVEKKFAQSLYVLDGERFLDESKFSLLLGVGLAKQVQAKAGDNLTLLGQTLDGSINAIDLSVAGIVQTGINEVDNLTLYMPLKAAQRLLDTNAVERIVMLQTDDNSLEQDVAKVAAQLPENMAVRKWYDLADLYRQTVAFFNVQNTVIELIILAMVLLAISNTTSNSVMERMGEIGTVRALGDTRRQVIGQFVLESLALSLISGVFACLLSLVLSKIITAAAIPIPIPNASLPLPIGIIFIPSAYIKAFVLTSVACVLATIWPVYRITRLPVVEALKRNF